jgi:membrane protein
LLATAAVAVTPIVLPYLPLGGFGGIILAWLRRPALILLLMVAIALLYRFRPNCDQARWAWISAAGVFATLAWLAGSLA